MKNNQDVNQRGLFIPYLNFLKSELSNVTSNTV